MQLEPVVVALGRWAARSPFLPEGSLSVDSLILSFRTMFDRHAAEGFSASLELRIGEDRFHADVNRGRMELVRGSADEPSAILEGEADAFAGVVYGGRKLAEALRKGDLKIEGDKTAAKRFLTLFPLPERAAAASGV